MYHSTDCTALIVIIIKLVLRDVPCDCVLTGDVFHVRGDIIDVPLQDGGGVRLRQQAVRHQSVAQQVLGVHSGDEGSGVREI